MKNSFPIILGLLFFSLVMVGFPLPARGQINWSPDPIVYQRQVAVLADYIRSHPALMSQLFRLAQTGGLTSSFFGSSDSSFTFTPTRTAEEGPLVASAPIITSISPKQGRFGTKITISGSGFDQFNNYIETTYSLINGLASADGKTLQFVLRNPNDSAAMDIAGISDASTQDISDFTGSLANEKSIPVMIAVETIYGVSNTMEFSLIP